MINKTTFAEKYKGEKFGKLTILHQTVADKLENDGKVLYVRAKCDCGLEKTMFLNNIIYGMSKSCGCERSLSLSRNRRKSSKLTVATPDGPKTIRDLSLQYDVPYQRIYSRFQDGLRTIEELVGKRKRKEHVKLADKRLNMMNQVEAVKEFKISKQVVSLRLKKGWTINKENKWVSPHRGVVGRRVYRPSKLALRRLKNKRKNL